MAAAGVGADDAIVAAAAAAAPDPAVALANAAAALGGGSPNRLADLAARRKELKRQQQAIKQQEKNEKKRRKRQMSAASRLSPEDLAQVLGLKAVAVNSQDAADTAGNYALAAAASSAPAVHRLPCDQRPSALECCFALLA